MIDRVARDQLAEQLRHLASGSISNDRFEEMLPRSEDPGVEEVREAAWMLYTDLHEQWLRSEDALRAGSRRAVARWIVFLHSDLEYEWPKHPCVGIRRLIATFVNFGAIPRYLDRRWAGAGDFEFWPFLRAHECDKAASHPRFRSTRAS